MEILQKNYHKNGKSQLPLIDFCYNSLIYFNCILVVNCTYSNNWALHPVCAADPW